MKKLLALFVLIVAVSAPAPTTNSPSVTLGWDRVDSVGVTGYAVYVGVATRVYTNRTAVVGADTLTCTLTNLARGQKYFFAATTVAGPLESDYSVEVTYDTTPLPAQPANFKITVTTP